LSAAGTIRAKDSNALLIVNFADRANLDALLTKAGANANVDVFSLDRYDYSTAQYGPLESVRSHALAAKKPYWRYADSFAYANGDEHPSEADMRWDAMVGLVYGFTGFTWFIYQIDSPSDLLPELFDQGGSFAATKSARYAIAAAINTEVKHFGRALSQLTSTGVRYVAGTSLLQPKNTQPWATGAGGHPYLSAITTSGALDDVHVGFFVDDCGESYVMLLNPKHAHAKFPLSSEGPTTATLSFDFSNATDPSLDRAHVSSLDPTDGVVKPLALTPSGANGANGATLQVTLGAGKAMLFKHTNGRSFVLQ